MKKNVSVLFVCVLYSQTALADLIQWDAFTIGDNLAVKDKETGLVWLDLDLTAGQNFDLVGSSFSGWELPNYMQVENLLEKAFPDIVFSGSLGLPNNFEENCANTTLCFSTATEWQNLFGSVEGIPSFQTYSYGLYRDEQGILRMGGSFRNGSGSANRYGVEFSVDYGQNYQQVFDNEGFANFGAFLVQTDSLPVITPISDSTPVSDGFVTEVNAPNISSLFTFGLVVLLGFLVRVRSRVSGSTVA
jgi:hypothetical protein